MADKKISALSVASAPLAGTEVLPIVQSGATVQVSVDNLTVGKSVETGPLTVKKSQAGATTTLTIQNGNAAASSDVALAATTANGTWTTSWGRSTGVMKVNSSNGVDVLSIAAAGDVTILGTTKTDGLISHAGSGGAYQSNKFNFQWTGSPALWVDTTLLGNINYTSDYRIKRNIASQTESGIAKVMQLRPVVYQLANYNNLFVASDDIKEGFIAHEVQAVIPSGAEGVKDAEDQIQSLRLDAILSVVVKAMQEQQEQIEALKAEVAALKGA